MGKKAITYEQSCALIIMTAHKMGYNVTMLNEAENIIKNKHSLEPCSILDFERVSCDAHEKVRLDGIEAVTKANSICNSIRDDYNI